MSLVNNMTFINVKKKKKEINYMNKSHSHNKKY